MMGGDRNTTVWSVWREFWRMVLGKGLVNGLHGDCKQLRKGHLSPLLLVLVSVSFSLSRSLFSWLNDAGLRY